MTRLILVALAVGMFGGVVQTQAQKQDQLFPHTKKLGKAIVRYEDKTPGLGVVVEYEYSQRHHDSTWLLLDVAATAEQRLVLDREHFKLVSPTGQWFPVASQRHFLEGANEITSLRQNAKIFRHSLQSYLGQREYRETLKLFALPGEGVVIAGAMLDRDRIMTGELYFEMPQGSWEPGQYSLLVEHPRASAALPISLE
jgi:hypothetical protein